MLHAARATNHDDVGSGAQHLWMQRGNKASNQTGYHPPHPENNKPVSYTLHARTLAGSRCEPCAKLMSGDRLPHVGPFPCWNRGPWGHHVPHSIPKMDLTWNCHPSTQSFARGSCSTCLRHTICALPRPGYPLVCGFNKQEGSPV